MRPATCRPVHDRAYAHTQRLLTWLHRDHPPRFLPAHVPLLLDRDILLNLERRIPEAFLETSQHVFRSPQDAVVRILYLLHLTEDPEELNRHEVVQLDDQGPEYALLRLDQGQRFVKGMLAGIEAHRPAFFCINDDLHESGDAHPVLQATRAFLGRVAPHTSPVERHDSATY